MTQFARHGICATSVNNAASVAKNGIYISVFKYVSDTDWD